MDFKDHADEIVRTELAAELTHRNVILERDFRSMIHSKYGFSDTTAVCSMRRMSDQLGLVRRHLTNELKNFYSLDMPGFPVAYLSNK